MSAMVTAFGTKVAEDLIKKVASELLNQYKGDNQIKDTLGTLMPGEDQLKDGIKRLLEEGKLDFGDATQLAQFTDSLLGKVTNAVANFQRGTLGTLPVTKLFGLDSIKEVLARIPCGAIEGRKLDAGPPGGITTLPNGRYVIRYYLEGLPNVGSIAKSALAFMMAAESWAQHLNLEISEETDDPKNANLVVSYETLQAPPAVLALTDVGSAGPKQGGQLRMAFDMAEPAWSALQLQATAAHELGHALGIRHADVTQRNSLMNDTLNIAIIEPQPADVAAAVAKGWGTR